MSDVARGESLFHTVGCVACHLPRRGPDEGGGVPQVQGHVELTHVPAKYGLDSLAAFLFEPQRVRPDGRMPDMGLDRAEARAIASYLIGSGAPAREALTVDGELAKAGEQYFQTLRCTACHEMEGLPPSPPRPRQGLAPERGCLSPIDARSPRFSLDDSQRSALKKAMASPAAQLSTDEHIAAVLATFNCIACHERDGYGGVDRALDAYFKTDEPNLGDHARLPPRLTLAGAKLQPAWLRKVLFDGATARPYMRTRMPRFGEANLAGLPALLAQADHIEPFEMPVYKGKEARAARDGARKLLGTDGAGCVTCHNFNGRLSPNMKGLDLIDSCERLQPGWFAAFLQAPQKMRPGIVMPQYWPGGTAVQTTILDGDAEKQIRALWFFLAEGRTARTPVGLAPRPSRLVVEKRTRTYRGRSNVAGFRGVAVGFPGGVNYAFDAKHGTLSAVWRGGYVSVRWDGQGAGDFRPAARAIQLARDVSLYRLEDDAEPWPLRPIMTKEQPVNSDPLYPRNRGYRFRGYFFDDDAVPTFLYESGAIAIEDRSTGRMDGKRAVLRRVLRLQHRARRSCGFERWSAKSRRSPLAVSGSANCS